MRIDEILAARRPVFSFEFFPPKTPAATEQLLRALDDLKKLSPDFVSVTYGAMGSNRGQVLELVSQIKNDVGLNPMAHLSCTGHTGDEIAAILDQLVAARIDNVLPLRGDPPRGEVFRPVAGGFAHASDLVAFIRSRWAGFCLAGACYPEVHPDAPDAATDLQHLVTKVRAGVNFLITQLFFDNRDYFAFVERARAAGITVPILPGIMPVVDVGGAKRMSAMCGARIPDSLMADLDAADGDPSRVLAAGVEHAMAQCRDLLARGAPGIHFYTLNKSPATRLILATLRG
ncbi:MAG TPA: methylenetetrahydrofolate reductase [NAD(P)H] [Candidatus Binatia bacterium]|nr:methylenetetrahydrofolate reductase [NAD(P)H] [Candidatus Binatia bacterium]